MALFIRKDLPKILGSAEAGSPSSAYLIFGDRFLCQDAASDLIQRLLPDERQRLLSLKTVDGENEDVQATINMLKTYSLFGGRQVIRVVDSRLFHSKAVAATFWEKAEKAFVAKELVQAGRFLSKMLGLVGLSSSDWPEEVSECGPDRWQALFGFLRPENITWVQEVFAATEAPEKMSVQRHDAADLLTGVLEHGIPASNILIVIAEAVDKRKRLYKFFEKNCTVIDLSVDTGTTSAARKGQEAVLKELVHETLGRLGKKIEPQCLPILFERVGFHPVAIVMETEKLALSVGEEPLIVRADLDIILSRSREEALYELNETLGAKNLQGALLSLKRLRENGMHSLAIVAGVRNFLRKLMLARAYQEQNAPKYVKEIAFPVFQKGYLPQLQEAFGKKMPDLLGGHPFVVYKLFRQAEMFSLPLLKKSLAALLLAEYRLKGSPLADDLILENFIFTLLREDQQAIAMEA